ncbi:hypothetical protein HMPREF1544_02846 [Mucor circinelloides 1006PhL]|uniref:Cas12f1-like TNB domain-containing protein n=1 Tax=Mucor circinelloides f. circinelloides (strain 1006PhL) TaxID=1220926 RepID=S2JJ29_MUCC1|nr:hypothetical protein HMPREF1544_02846 [Mucor circinelloides 1006PhL]
MSYCILLDSSGTKGVGDSGPRKKKGKEKAKDVASSIPADFFEDEEYEDFQVPIGLRPPPSTIAREQRDIEEATRLSLQRQGVAESGESSSSTNVRQTPQIARSTVIADFEEDDDFQEPIVIRPRTTRATPSITTPVQASTQSTGMSQEFKKAVSLTPSTPSESSSAPVYLSEKVKMKQARSEAKRKARQKSSTTKSKRNPNVALQQKWLKSAEDFNQDQRTGFITEIRRVVRHLSDVTYAASLFLNWFCLRLLRNGEAVPKLTHKRLYNFAALFVGQGKNADADIREAFTEFATAMGEDFNRQQLFPNIQYSTLITIVMRSYETLIENHVGTNFKPKTVRYLFTRLSGTAEFPNLPFRTGVKCDLAERVYNALTTNQEITYPAKLEVADAHSTSINNLLQECRQRLRGLNLTEEDYYAQPHLYLPWLYHVLERMEQQVTIREPVPQTRVTKGFVHRQLAEIVDFRRLPRRFRSTLETHVKDSINLEHPTIQQYINHSFLEDTQRPRTKASISRKEFRPEQYTDPRGARLFNILPIYNLQQRYIQLNLSGISRIIKQSRIRPSVLANEDMKDVCWSLFDMSRIGFRSANDLDGKALSDKRFTGAIRTDGIALEFICDRPSVAAEAALTPADIATEIDMNTATIWGLDPGIRDVFVASDGVGTGAGQDRQRHRIRKTSTGEYYQLCGFKSAIIKRAKHDQANADARRLISDTPSTKTCDWDRLNQALRYIFRNFQTIKDYYTTGLRKLKYHSYRNKQKASTEMCKRLFTANQQKWKPLAPRDNAGEAERPTVVAFGSALFGGLRGNVPSPTKVFRKALLNYVKSIRRNRPNSRKYVVMIDEYLTSQICPRCHLRSTTNERDNANMKIHPVLSCNTCHTRWNRDHMASLNIRSIFLHMAANNNNRPEEFQRGMLS